MVLTDTMKKTLMKPFLLTGLLAFLLLQANAQLNTGPDYKTAIGVKVYPGAITVKHFLSDGKAVEGIGYLTSDGFRVTGLYELHYDLGNVEGLKWYGKSVV